MESGAERLIDRALSAWVDGVRRRARAVLVGTAALTVALAVYTVLYLGVNTQHTALLDEKLAFWRHYNAFADVFPILDEALLVVVDAETPGRARSATDALAARLAEREELFADVYVPGGGEFFERRALLYLSVEELEDLTDDLASVQPLLADLSRDSSLSNLAQVLTDGIDLVREEPDVPVDLSAVFDSLSVAVDAVLDGRPRPISWTEMLLERKLPGESSRRVIVLQPVFDYDSLLPGRAAMQVVRDTAAELGLDAERGFDVRITGNVALNTEEMVLVAQQVLAMGGLSFAMIAAILWLALRSRRLVLSVLVTLVVGLVWTLGFATASVGHLNVISVAFAILFIGLGVDFGIHFCMRYAELVRSGESHDASLRDTARTVGDSLVLCALTTAIGFYVFVPTHYRAVGELGLISGTGMVISLFCTLTVLPALLSAGDVRVVGREWAGSRWVIRVLVHLAVTRSRPIRWTAAALGLGAFLVLPRVHFDHNVVAMRDHSTESVKTFNELLEDSETSPWTVDIMEPDLASARATALRLRELDVVDRAVTLADYVPEEQDDKLLLLEDLAFFLPEISPEKVETQEDLAGQIAALRALQRALRSPWLRQGDPERIESARRAEERLGLFLERLESIERKRKVQALEEFEKSLTGELNADMLRLWNALDPEPITLDALPADLRARMVADDGRARIEVLPAEDLSDNEAHARFVDEIRDAAPHATGSAVTVLEWARAVVDAFRLALTLGVVAIALLLWLLWRNLRHMTLVILPLTLAALLTCATAIGVGIDFNFVNVVVIPLLLGIGVDSGVHLVHRYRVTLEREPGRAATERDLLGTSTAQAVFFSALTTMGSFGALGLVTHGGIRTMGLLLLIGVGFMLLCNLVVLPALIAMVRTERGPASSDAEVAA